MKLFNLVKLFFTFHNISWDIFGSSLSAITSWMSHVFHTHLTSNKGAATKPFLLPNFKAHPSEHCWKHSVWDPLVQWWLSMFSIFKHLTLPLCEFIAVRLHHKWSWSHLVMSARNPNYYTIKGSHQCWTVGACCCLFIWSPLPPKSAPASYKCNYFSSFYSKACTCHRYLPEV